MLDMMRFLSSLVLPVSGVLAQMLDPEPCTGECFIHDPALIQSANGTYFLYGSGPGVTVKTAPSLTGPWTPPSRVFDTDDQLGVSLLLHLSNGVLTELSGTRHPESWRHFLALLPAHSHWHKPIQHQRRLYN